MNRRPIRLLDDPTLGASERELLEAGARHMPVAYDQVAGMARFVASVEALKTLPPGGATAAEGATGAKLGGLSAKLIAKIGVALLTPVAAVITAHMTGMIGSDDGLDQEQQVVNHTADESQNLTPNAGPSHPAHSTREASSDTSVRRVVSRKDSPTTEKSSQGLRQTHSRFKRRLRPRASVSMKPANATRISTKRSAAKASSFGTDAISSVPSSNAYSVVGDDTRADEPLKFAEIEPTTQTESPQPREEELTVRSDKQSDREETEETEQPAPTRAALEMKAIALARRLLTTDPGEALELLEQTGHDYPRGYFIEERRALTIFALFASGNTTRARESALSFLHDYPQGLFTDQVKKALVRAGREKTDKRGRR